MDPTEAIAAMKTCCNHVSAELTRLTPLVSQIGNRQIQDQLLPALFQLTKDLEAVKKLVRKAENAPSEQ